MDDGVIKIKGRRYWVLEPSALYAGDEVRLDWEALFPPAIGTPAQRAALTRACKAVLEAVVSAPRSRYGSGIPGHLTVRNWFGQIKRLARWMIVRGIWRFSRLTLGDAEEYLQSMRPRGSGPGPIAEGSLRRRVHLLQCLWDFRSVLPDAITFDVNCIESEILARMHLRRSIPWRPIGEADAMRLLAHSKRWMDAHAGYVSLLLERLWGEQKCVAGMTGKKAKSRRQSFYQALLNEPEFVRLSEDLAMAGREPYMVLRAGVTALEGAAYTSILLLVGLRAREMVRLDVDCVQSAIDGDPDSLLLAGIAAKKGGMKRTWAITPAVKDVVDAMRQMLAVPRAVSKQTSLMLDGAARKCGIFPGARLPQRPSASDVTVKMRKFARLVFVGEEDLANSVHAHAARKTFARFVVMRDKRVLESLAYHFGHTHRAITDGYYVGADMELAQLLDAENRQDLANSLADLLSSRSIAGKAGRAFMSGRDSLMRMRGKATLQSVVKKLIADGVHLAPCDWGYCVYSKALSACRGSSSGPNEVERTAEVCAGCSNFVVTERHRAWWEARVVRDQLFLEDKNLPVQTVTIVERRLSRSAELLSELNSSRVLAGVRDEKGPEG